jgi:subtilase family protein
MQGLVAAGACIALCAAAAEASAVSPLPASDYSVRSVCAPAPPRHAGCLSLQLVPMTAAARAYTHPLGRTRIAPSPAPSPASFGLTPEDLHSAYRLPNSASLTQTVALVDAYNDPNAEADLAAYGLAFGVPGECTTANGCFEQVNQNGQPGNPPFPKTTAELEAARKGTLAQKEEASEAEGWGLEISLDIEVARAICQSCRILLVEANSSSYQDLEQAEHAAIALGATAISNSWGGQEVTPEMEASGPFNNPGTVITAAAGDNGYLGWSAPNSFERGFADFPASSPHVVAVGGTQLSVTAGGSWAGEAVWNGKGAGGGGCSVEFTAPPWQQSVAGWSGVGCEARRGVADVSADADPYSGVAVHDSSAQCEASYEEGGTKHVLHWCTLGGTSLASPLVASVFALAGGAGGVAYPARTLYENEARSPASLHDVVSGSNGACSKGFNHKTGVSLCTAAEEAQSCAPKLVCLAGTGYDGPTGVGTPNGIAAFQPTGEGEVEKPKPEGGGASPTPTITPSPNSTGSSAGPAPPPPAAPVSIQISRLSLTLNAIISLNRGRARTSQLGFAFDINFPVRVHASLAKRVRVRGHARWKPMRGSVSFDATVGYNSRRLGGRGLLLAGLYRLTLSPARGSGRSMVFHIG